MTNRELSCTRLLEGADRLVMIEKYESEQARLEHFSGKAIADVMSALEGKLSRDPDIQILEPRPAGGAKKGSL